MDKKTKTALIVFGVILIIGIILGIIGSDETETNNTNNESNNSNVQNLPSYIIKSDKGLYGAEFSFNLEQFIEKYNNYMDKQLSGMYKLNLSEFKDITESAKQNISDDRLIKRYYCELPKYNVYQSDSYALIIDYTSEDKIGKITFMTNGTDIATGGVVSRIFQSIFSMTTDKASSTITNIKNHNADGEKSGYDSDYSIGWWTENSNNLTYFSIVPKIDQ